MIRGLLADNGVAFIPSVVPGSIERFEVPAKNGVNFVTRLWLNVKFVDGDSGEILESTWPGEGQDNADKGCYKAITGAEKYALMKTFLIPTGDDPENENDAERGSIVKSSAKQESKTDRAWTEHRAADPSAVTPPIHTETSSDRAPSNVISEAQSKRLFAIAREKGWAVEDVKGIVKAAGFESSKDITKDRYDAIIKTLEAGPKVPAHAD
jgi:hypothetical protein